MLSLLRAFSAVFFFCRVLFFMIFDLGFQFVLYSQTILSQSCQLPLVFMYCTGFGALRLRNCCFFIWMSRRIKIIYLRLFVFHGLFLVKGPKTSRISHCKKSRCRKLFKYSVWLKIGRLRKVEIICKGVIWIIKIYLRVDLALESLVLSWIRL